MTAHHGCFAGAAIGLTLLQLLLAPTVAPQGTYPEELSTQLEIAGGHLADAGDAIRDCDAVIISCLGNPEPYATRIDAAVAGLNEVQINLSAMTVPGAHAQDHQLLRSGIAKVTDGLALYASGIRAGDPALMSQAADLVHEGTGEIEAARARILAQPAGVNQLFLVLIVSAVGITFALAALIVAAYRQGASDRRRKLEEEVATCPVCGEVLDRWSTYRRRQIREWREAHLKTHAQERTDEASGKS